MTAHPSKAYFKSIDGIRAIAILTVLAFHLDPEILPKGFLGVDMFFVISGFVVTAAIARYFGGNYSRIGFRKFLATFYSRRFCRILPALLFSILISNIFAVLLIPPGWLSGSFEKVARAAHLGYANFVLRSDVLDYFSPQAENNPFTHCWSLGVEEQFYVIFPFFAFGMMKYPRTRRWVLPLLALVAGASLVFASLESNSTKAFYLPQYRIWELLAGVLSFHLSQAKTFQKRLLGLSQNKGLFGILSALILAVTLIPFAVPHPLGTPALVTGTSLLLLLSTGAASPVSRLLSHPILRWIGLASFSIYLFHWPIVVLFKWTVGLQLFWYKIAALFLTLGLSAFSFYFVENPTRGLYSRFSAKKIFLFGIPIVLLSSELTKFAYMNHSTWTLSTVGKNIADWYPHKFKIGDSNCTSSQIGVRPFVWDIRREGLHCPPPTEPRKLFVIGDSHAETYVPLLRKLNLETGQSILMFSLPECRPLDFERSLTEISEACRDFLKDSVGAILKEARAGDLLFLPALRVKRFAEQWKLNVLGSPPSEALRNAAAELFISQFQPLASAGIHIILEAPKPVFSSPVFRCVDEFTKNNPICVRGIEINREFLVTYREPTLETMRALGTRLAQVKIFDPFPSLCPKSPHGLCSALKDGKPLFLDSDHVSSLGSLSIYPDFRRFIDSLR